VNGTRPGRLVGHVTRVRHANLDANRSTAAATNFFRGCAERARCPHVDSHWPFFERTVGV